MTLKTDYKQTSENDLFRMTANGWIGTLGTIGLVNIILGLQQDLKQYGRASNYIYRVNY